MPATLTTDDFGSLLKFLRKRARLTQRDLAQAVGYTEAHICRLEKNERLPDLTTIAALFIPALEIKDKPEMMERLLALAAKSRHERGPASVKINLITIEHLVEQELGTLEEVPAQLAHLVARTALTKRVKTALESERCVALCGMAGIGKTALAATIARDCKSKPVFWQTLIEGVSTSAEAIVRQLALFFLANGQTQVRPLVERGNDAPLMQLDQQLLLIRSALAHQPALLCFDDVHLLLENEASLSLLRHLTATTSASLLLTSRQEVPLPVTQINLDGLETSEALELIQRLGLSLEPGSVNRILSKTDHNPMLIRLVAGQLLESRVEADALIEHIETRSQVASYLLRTILNDLSPDARWLAEFISVFRHSLDLYDETLAELVEHIDPPCHLNNAIDQLQRRYLINDAHSAALHPLVRDHLSATLTANATHKKRLHRLAAELSERGTGAVVEAAYHWMCAGDLEQVAEMLGDRSELLFNQGQAQAAVQVVDEALRWVQRKRGNTTNLRRRLLTARGDLLRGTLRAAEAENSYREALALAHNLPTVRAQIVRNLAQILMQRGQSAEALRLCQSAMADLAPTDTVAIARLASIQCRAHLVLSQYDDAERVANDAIALTAEFAEFMPNLANDVWARAERTLGWINYTRHPEGTESLIHYRRALECARRAGLRVIECAILSNTATALLERGDLDGALQTYEQALKGFESLGDLYGVAGVLHNLGTVLSAREEHEAALARFEQASEIERSVGDYEGLLSSESARASIFLGLGRLTEARAALDNVLIDERSSTDTWTIGTALCLLAEVQLVQGEVETARSTAMRVLAMPGIQNNARIHAWAQSDLALIQIGAGEFEAAASMVATAPLDDLGFELTTRWQLVQSAAALSCGDVETAEQIARAVFEAAHEKGLKQLEQVASKILANPEYPVHGLPRLVLIGPEN